MTDMTKAEYADSRGWSRPYVSKLFKQGRLVMTDDGKRVNAEASDERIAETADPSKGGVSQRNQQKKIKQHVQQHVQADAPPLDDPGKTPPAGAHDYQSSRAKREHYLAQLAEMEAMKAQGELARVEDIRLAAFATARMLRDLLLGLPRQIGPELAAISDPWELERKLTQEIRRVLTDAERVSANDLDNAITKLN